MFDTIFYTRIVVSEHIPISQSVILPCDQELNLFIIKESHSCTSALLDRCCHDVVNFKDDGDRNEVLDGIYNILLLHQYDGICSGGYEPRDKLEEAEQHWVDKLLPLEGTDILLSKGDHVSGLGDFCDNHEMKDVGTE